ncbi:hypothetical protein Tco_0877401 [Tanacetum coccineum]|uniref:Integrase, catalytic region, zinc finger, CCHC-type, peptidase aspartic, catalytic n=1 Tax=Tanacetum coccineum TaxID=301880 RepID=A0ABQ5BV22_9ASTR
MVFGLRLFKTYDGESLKAQELCEKVHQDGNNHVGAIMGYGDYMIGDSVVSRAYYVEGLGHNLFSVGQFCDSDLEVAFRKHSCFVRNMDGVDLLKGWRNTNLYTISVDEMAPLMQLRFSVGGFRIRDEVRWGSAPFLEIDWLAGLQRSKDQYGHLNKQMHEYIACWMLCSKSLDESQPKKTYAFCSIRFPSVL